VTVVKGHGLQREGRPYFDGTCPECSKRIADTRFYEAATGAYVVAFISAGHALCRCGWLSSHDDTNRGRQAKHRVHKKNILAEQENS
jgi:hypothetical protein